MNKFDEPTMRALFTLADIEVIRVWRLPNRYWCRPQADAESPWWLVKTRVGLIEIGWRKRVIAIDWSDTRIAVSVTEDDVTKDHFRVHAWSTEKAIEYLRALSCQIRSIVFAEAGDC